MGIFQKKGPYGDKAIQNFFKRNKQLGSRDRKIIASTVYYIIRWWKKLWYAIDHSPTNEAKQLQKIISAALQINYIVKNKKELATIPSNFNTTYNAIDLDIAIKESIPNWLHEIGKHQYNKDWKQIIEALNQTAPLTIRTNTLKTSVEGLKVKFAEKNINVKKGKISNQSLIIEQRQSLLHDKLFLSGHFEFQDEGSQKVGMICNPKPGMTIIDYCAGGGGKSLHLAALMKNQGQIYAADLHQNRLNELKKRMKRAGTTIISCIDLNELPNNADLVLLDVPCSGLGTLKRKPDLKWKLTKSKIDKYLQIQREILEKSKYLVKIGGHLVYATCSILLSEGENQIQWFLEQNSNFSLETEERIHPFSSDGFYIAKLQNNT